MQAGMAMLVGPARVRATGATVGWKVVVHPKSSRLTEWCVPLEAEAQLPAVVPVQGKALGTARSGSGWLALMALSCS